jgi:WD40 repeat protein
MPAPRAQRRLAVALAAALLLALALLTPAGAAIRDWIDDAIETGTDPAPSLTSLPAPGRILVESEQGPWIVNQDGSQRRLGDYEGAAWSPSGLYVVAVRDGRLVALEPDGDVRWTVSRARPVRDPDWQSPEGFRIAYLSGRSLRIVAGDGTGDRLLAKRALLVKPAWRPGLTPILAFADETGALRVVNTESGRSVASAPRSPTELAWSPEGRRLVAVWGSSLSVLGRGGATEVGTAVDRPGSRIRSVEFSPSGEALAFIRRSRRGGTQRSGLIVAGARGAPIRERVLFTAPGRFTDLTWSPDGRWLLLAWEDADQWLFIDVRRPSRIRAVAGISRQFDPGGEGSSTFPQISGWCCAP